MELNRIKGISGHFVRAGPQGLEGSINSSGVSERGGEEEEEEEEEDEEEGHDDL